MMMTMPMVTGSAAALETRMTRFTAASETTYFLWCCYCFVCLYLHVFNYINLWITKQAMHVDISSVQLSHRSTASGWLRMNIVQMSHLSTASGWLRMNIYSLHIKLNFCWKKSATKFSMWQLWLKMQIYSLPNRTKVLPIKVGCKAVLC